MGKTMYKGFDKDLKCRGFQYEVNKEYVHDGKVEACESGFHACENPFDVFDFYAPNEFHRFCEVEGSGKEDKWDGKSSFEKIKIVIETGLGGLISAGVKFCLDRVRWTDETSATGFKSGASATGNYSGASVTGNHSVASVTGDYSGASATGNCSGASATGFKSGASATGFKSGASATGNCSGASTTGNCSGASVTGDYSGASATGNCSGASATGHRSGASATGRRSGASATGDCSGASATGNYCGASATGDCSGASATGNYCGASATGDCSGASATGNYCGASATGNCSGALATGHRSGASAGKGSVALSVGRDTRAKGSLGSWIVLTQCHHDESDGEDYIDTVKVAKVDGKRIKADTWYTLEEGKFVLANDNDYEGD